MNAFTTPYVVAFFTPGPWEMGIIALLAVLLFGNRLPKVARGIGSSFIEFKRGLSGIENDVNDFKSTVDEAVNSTKSAAKQAAKQE